MFPIIYDFVNNNVVLMKSIALILFLALLLQNYLICRKRTFKHPDMTFLSILGMFFIFNVYFSSILIIQPKIILFTPFAIVTMAFVTGGIMHISATHIAIRFKG